DLCARPRGKASGRCGCVRGACSTCAGLLRDAVVVSQAVVRRRVMRVQPWSDALAPRSKELVVAIEQRRGGALLNLDRMLLWSDPLARSWNGYLRAVRTELSLSPFLRELAICVVARLTGAQYEYHHHAPELARAAASPAQIAALDDPDAAASGSDFDELQRTVIRFASASTRTVAVPEEIFDALKRWLEPPELVDLPALTPTYNVVALFLVPRKVVRERKTAEEGSRRPPPLQSR